VKLNLGIPNKIPFTVRRERTVSPSTLSRVRALAPTGEFLIEPYNGHAKKMDNLAKREKISKVGEGEAKGAFCSKDQQLKGPLLCWMRSGSC